MKALLVEDNALDATRCVRLLKTLGANEVQAFNSVAAALRCLDEVLEKKRPAPDLLVLDLAFPMESGFEILRRWKAHAGLKAIPIIVWTEMGDTEERLCQYFGVECVVRKEAGIKELELAVKRITQ